MAGLLDRISGGVGKFMDNPLVQSLAAGAATGFNPLVGLLAYPAIQDERRQREQDLEDRRRALQASDRFSELSRQTVPDRMNIMGLDGVPMMGDNGLPMELTARQPQSSRGDGSLLPVNNRFTPALNPNAAPQVAGLLGPDRPSARVELVNEYMEAIQNGDQERADALMMQLQGQGGDPLDQMLAMLTIQQRQDQIARERKEDQEKAAKRKTRLQAAAEDIGTLYDRIVNLEDSGILGNPLPTERLMSMATLAPDALIEATTDFFGEPKTKAEIQRMLDQQQDFNTYATGVLVNTTQSLEGYGSMAGRTTLQETKPRAGIGFRPNLSATARMAREALLADQLAGYTELTQSQRDKLKRIIEHAERAYSDTGDSGGEPEYVTTPDGRIVPRRQ